MPRAEALLELAGAESLSLGDAADDPILEPAPNETPLWPAVELSALFAEGANLDALRAVLAGACESAHAFALGALDEDAWRAAAQRGIPPRRFGTRIWLAPANDPAIPAGLIGVRLHMGLAFGTGEHPTTALCLEWLDAELEPGARVLDYGCGSGILAIAGARLGAGRVVGTDVDPQAIRASEDNARANEVAATFVLPDALHPGSFDMVVANILANPLTLLAPALALRVRVGGRIALSGILEPQAAMVAAAYGRWFNIGPWDSRDGWVLLAGERVADPGPPHA